MYAQLEAVKMSEVKTETSPANWSWLFKAGAAASLLTVVFLPIQIAVFLIYPLPSTVTGWFALFQSSKLVGLLDLDLLLMADQVLAILIFLALYQALRRSGESIMLILTALGLASTVLFIASNPAFAMLTLSDQYAAAATDAQRAIYLAAGQTAMAMWQGSAFQASYLLGSIATILISAVMLRSKIFSRACAYLGLLANVIALGLYVPVIGIYISVFSVVFLWVWYLLMIPAFYRLGNSIPGAAK